MDVVKNINPRFVELFTLLCSDFLDAYEHQCKERGSIERNELISVAVSDVLGRSAFSMKSVLDGYQGLNLERARTLIGLHKLGGKASLGEVKEELGLTRQAAYSRLVALCASGYCEKKETAYGMYFMTDKGKKAAAEISNVE